MAGDSDLTALLQRNRRYRRVFGSIEGRWVLNDILKVAGFSRTDVTADAGEALARENRKFIPLHICTVMNMNDAEIMRRAQNPNAEVADVP